jgi:hypothetical protein
MDKFVLVTGIAGLLLLSLSLILLIYIVVNVIKGRTKIKRSIYGTLVFLITIVFASSLIYLSLFLQTFTRYTYEKKIGWIYTEPVGDSTRMTFYQEKENRMHFFTTAGEQWMVEGYFLRWNTALRWLGAGAYYRITRFSGRWENTEAKMTSVYQMHPEEGLWEFLLKHAEKIPGVDAAYGIGVFQYPSPDTFYLYVNDTGFILRKH